MEQGKGEDSSPPINSEEEIRADGKEGVYTRPANRLINLPEQSELKTDPGKKASGNHEQTVGKSYQERAQAVADRIKIQDGSVKKVGALALFKSFFKK